MKNKKKSLLKKKFYSNKKQYSSDLGQTNKITKNILY